MTEQRCIVTFPSTYHALRAERVSKAAGFSVSMIPVPRGISADCNIGMEVRSEHADSLRGVLEKARVDCDFVRR